MNEKIYKSPLGFSKYLVSHDGQSVINAKTGQERKFQDNKGNGYIELSVQDADGVPRRVGIHRLVALAHLKVPDNYEELTVNHIDTKKHNNHYKNLEWATYRENQEHAGKHNLTTKCIPVTAINRHTGALSHFPSILRCAERFGVSKDILNVRAKSFGRDPIGDFVFVETRHLSKFLVEFNKDNHKTYAKRKFKPVWVMDTETGDVTAFKSHGEFAAFFNVSMATVSNWLSGRDQVVVAGCYLVKQNEYEPWRDLSSPIDQMRLVRGRPIVLIDEVTGDRETYPSARAYCRQTGLAPTCVSYRLSIKGGQVFSDGKRYFYQDELDTVRLPTGNR